MSNCNKKKKEKNEEKQCQPSHGRACLEKPAFEIFVPEFGHWPLAPGVEGECTINVFIYKVGFLKSWHFAYSFTRAEEPSLPGYLPIAGERIRGFIPFPKALLCEMQSASFRIWTRVTMSISYDDNHYTKGTSSWHFAY